MNQHQREALIDLLNLAILSDRHISLKEDEALQSALQEIGWDSERPREIHFLNSISRASRANDSDDATAKFIAMRAAAFESASDKEEAIGFVKSFLASDGLSSEESAFLSKLETAFRAS